MDRSIILSGVIAPWMQWGEINSYDFGWQTSDLGAGDSLSVTLNTDGGSIDEANLIISQIMDLRKRGVKTSVKIINAISAGSFLIFAFDKIKIVESGFIMIHNASAGIYGDSKDYEKWSVILKVATENMAAMYAERTGKDKAEFIKMMDEETWLNAEQAKELGFVDEIVSSFSMVAKLENVNFSKAPKEFLTLNNKRSSRMTKKNSIEPEKKETVVEPTAEPVVEPTTEPVEEPSKEVEPVVEPTVEPEPVVEVENEFQKGVKAERKRISDIRNLSAQGQEEIVADLINNGISLEQAAVQLMQDMKAKLEAGKMTAANSGRRSTHAPINMGEGNNEAESLRKQAMSITDPVARKKFMAENKVKV